MKTPLLLVSICFYAFSISAQMITNYTSADGLGSDAVNDIAIDENEAIWFATQGGLTKYSTNTWTTYDLSTAPDMIHDQITAVASDGKGGIWIGTDFGASLFSGGTWQNYDDNTGLGDNRINHIFIDSDGLVWMGHNDGVSVFDGSMWTSFDRNDGLPFGGVTYTAEDSEGVIYLATPLGGVFVLSRNNWTSITESNGLLSNSVTSIAIDADDNKWIGTSDGISVFDKNNSHIRNETRVLTLPPPDTLNPIEDVLVDNDGRIWAGVYVDYLVTEGGVSYLDGTMWKQFDAQSGLAGPVVRGMAADVNNDIWVATSTGVSQISLRSTSTDNLFVSDLTIYPNPTHDHLFINKNEDQVWEQIDIYALNGQLVKSERNFVQGNLRIDVSDLGSGVYQVVAGNNVGRLIKH